LMKKAAATELREWKHEEKAKFKAELKELEARHVRMLSEDWKKRITESQQELTTKMAEASALEKQLLAKIKECEAWQKSLRLKERELNQQQEAREKALDAREKAVDAREKALDAKETEALASMKNRIRTLEKENAELSQSYRALEKVVSELRQSAKETKLRLSLTQQHADNNKQVAPSPQTPQQQRQHAIESLEQQMRKTQHTLQQLRAFSLPSPQRQGISGTASSATTPLFAKPGTPGGPINSVSSDDNTSINSDKDIKNAEELDRIVRKTKMYDDTDQVVKFLQEKAAATATKPNYNRRSPSS